MRWVHALALIAVGLLLVAVGAIDSVRPASTQPSKPQPIHRIDPTRRGSAELHQLFDWSNACDEAALTDPTVWERWPCDQVKPQPS